MAADGRFGGHIVSGHIDGTGVIRSMIREENAIWVSIGTSPQILHLIVEKGSICIDGISLTVAKVDETGFQVSVIPHTGEETALLEKVPGDPVNLENDVIGKYVERLLGIQKNEEEKKNPELRWNFCRNSDFKRRIFIMSQNNQYNTIEEALRDLREGKVILVTDDPDRENEGDLICAAEFATQENINFMATYAKGLICTPMSAEIAAKLNFRRWLLKIPIITELHLRWQWIMQTQRPVSRQQSVLIRSENVWTRRQNRKISEDRDMYFLLLPEKAVFW